MLVLVGAGVSFDLTKKGEQEIKKADKVYVDSYTTRIIAYNIPWEKASRDFIESFKILEEAKQKNIVLITAGDPLIATTHSTLIKECIKQKIPYKVIHNSSVYSTAPSASGLQIYKFGRTVTIPKFQKNFKPTSPIKRIAENLNNNMHTLVLIDTFEQMHIKEALENLLWMAEQENIALPNKIIVLEDLGRKELIYYDSIENLLSYDYGEGPFSIIIPSKLHAEEQEYLELIKHDNKRSR